MKTKEINKVISRLYDEVQKSGWSSHLYRDEDWSNLYRIREICNEVLPQGWKLVRNTVFGYSADGHSKHYLFDVEHVETGEVIIYCDVRAFAAGTVDQPWKAYDCTAVFCRADIYNK